jgi:rare lipoprotein A
MLYGAGMSQTAPPTHHLWARRASLLALALSVVAAASLQGCSSVPLRASGTAAIPAPTSNPIPRPDRDGAPERVPEDLTKVPDAVPRVEPILPKGPNKPYSVEGQGYEPQVEDKPFKQRGVASWYGTKFHGKRTASGEVYSMYGMSAAHRTLPIPSYVRVRNVANGKEVILRVNDRGPFHSQRMLDVSYTAAAKLEILARGSAEVEIERITFDDIRTGRWNKDASLPVMAAAEPSAAAPMVPAALAGAASITTASTASTAPATLASASTGAAKASPKGAAPIETRSVRPLVNAAPATDPAYALASRLEGAAPQAQPSAVAPLGNAVSEPLAVAQPPGASAPSASAAGGSAKAAPESRARAFTAAQTGFWVQVAAFSQRPGVEAFQKKVAQELAHLAPLLAVFQEGPGYRLQVGPYARRDEAQSAAQRVRDALKLTPMVVERR